MECQILSDFNHTGSVLFQALWEIPSIMVKNKNGGIDRDRVKGRSR